MIIIWICLASLFLTLLIILAIREGRKPIHFHQAQDLLDKHAELVSTHIESATTIKIIGSANCLNIDGLMDSEQILD